MLLSVGAVACTSSKSSGSASGSSSTLAASGSKALAASGSGNPCAGFTSAPSCYVASVTFSSPAATETGTAGNTAACATALRQAATGSKTGTAIVSIDLRSGPIPQMIVQLAKYNGPGVYASGTGSSMAFQYKGTTYSTGPNTGTSTAVVSSSGSMTLTVAGASTGAAGETVAGHGTLTCHNA